MRKHEDAICFNILLYVLYYLTKQFQLKVRLVFTQFSSADEVCPNLSIHVEIGIYIIILVYSVLYSVYIATLRLLKSSKSTQSDTFILYLLIPALHLNIFTDAPFHPRCLMHHFIHIFPKI